MNFLQTRQLTQNGLPYVWYQAVNGNPYGTDQQNAADTGELLVALNNLRVFRPDLAGAINNVVFTRTNYAPLEQNVDGLTNSKNLYDYYVVSGFAGFWPSRFSSLASSILDNIVSAPTVSTYGVSLPVSKLMCEPMLLSVFNLAPNAKLNGLADLVYLAHEARYSATGKFGAFSEGNSGLDNPSYVYEWVVKQDGSTWSIDDGEVNVGVVPIVFFKAAVGLLAIHNTAFTENMVSYVESQLPSPSSGYSDGVDENGRVDWSIIDKTNGMIIEAALYATNPPSPTPTPIPTPTPTPTTTPTTTPTLTPTSTPTPTPTPSSSTFGNTAIGTYKDTNDANAQSISYFTCTTSGSVTDIIAYVDGASSGNAMAALYAVSGSSPGTLLAQSSSVNIGTTFSWMDFQLQTPTTVTSGTTYGLAIMGNIPVNVALVTGTGQRTGGPGYGSYSNGFTNPFGTVWFNDFTGAMSIYATSTSSPTPTPTPTPTSTPTPTPTPTPTSSTFGNTAIGTYKDTNDANAQSISYFTCTTSGSVTDIIAYVDGASSGNAMAALYAVSGSSPGTLLAQSSSVNIGTTFSWMDFQLQTPYTTTAGTTYGLAIMGNVPVNIMIVAGTGQRTGGPGYGSYTNGFTSSFGTVWFNDLSGAMSIYATGTGSSTPTPTPTPTATPAPTSTPTTNPTLSTFGNTAIGTYKDQNDANAQSISYFKPTTTGTITDIIAYISGTTTGKATAALYATSGGSASTLLAQSISINIGTTFSWVDFQLQTPTTVTSGTTYGLAIMGNIPVNVVLIAGTGQRTGGPGYGSYTNGFTNPFGTIWFNDLIGAMSIYASGSTGTGTVASMYSSNDSSLLSSIPLTIVVVLVAVCITQLRHLNLPSNKKNPNETRRLRTVQIKHKIS